MDKEKTASTSTSTSTSASTDGQRRRGQHLIPPSPRSAPWLMFQHGNTRKNQTFYNICEPNKTYVKGIPEMRRKFCIGSSSHEGWLILTDCVVDDDKPDDYFLWNPVSLEKIQLPLIIYKSKECILDGVLSSPPSDPDSIVMLLYGYDPYFLLFCHPGDKKWIRKELQKFESSNNPQSLVAIRGKFYLMCMDSIHLEIERIRPETLSITQFEIERHYTSSVAPLCRFRTNYVVTCDDDLFMVHRWFQLLDHKEVMDLQVYKMDFTVMEWEEVRSWGDHVFFLGTHTTTSCSATEMGFTRGGYVYFTLGEDKSLYKFDLEDGSVSVSLPCPNLPTPWCSPEWMIKPTVRATDGRDSRRTEDKIHNNDDDNEEKDTIMQAVQKNVIKHYEKEEENSWGMLNKDVVELIVTYLHPVDYMHFREASRAFRSIAPIMRWRTSSPGIKEIDSLSPWLVFSKKNNGIYNFIDPTHNNEKYVMNLSYLLSDAEIRFSKDGWILMSKGNRSIFFFNPLTRATIQLPELENFSNSFDGICFSSSPTSSDCLVFAISKCGPYHVHIYSIHRGVDSWTYDRFHNNNDLPSDEEKNIVFIPCLNNPVFYRGAFYCLGYHGTLGVSEFNGSFSWKVLDKLQSPCNSYFDNFLVECEGELLAVFVGHLGKWVKIFRLVRHSEEKMIWIQVKSLGKHMLFISHSSCLSAVAPRSGMENKIYFPRLNDREEIICYSLDTGTYHYFGSQHSHQDFYDTKVQLYCSWIEPKWSENTDEELDWISH